MALIGDLEEGKKLWSNASWMLKVIIVVSTFLAISSVASLSDAVFKWKGFILDGIKFYELWVTTPFKVYAAQIDIILDDNSIDYLILLAIYFSSIIRLAYVKYGKDRFKYIFIFCMVLGYFNIAIGLSLISSNLTLWQIIGLCVLYFITPSYTEQSYQDKVIYYFPGAMAIIMVFILAAINSGISRPIN